MGIDLVQMIVEDRCLESMQDDGSVVLKECDTNVDMELTVSGLGADAAAIRLDGSIGGSSGIKNGPWKQMCDYLVIKFEPEKIRALFVELKKKASPEDSRGREQLRRSLPIFRYLYSILQIESCSDSKEVEIRYSLVSQFNNESGRLVKTRVRAGSSLPRMKYKKIQFTFYDGYPIIAFNSLWGE